MLSSLLLALAAAKAISAAPATPVTSEAVPAELLQKLADINLADPDIVLSLGSTGYEYVNYTRYLEKLVFEGVSLKTPEIDYDFLNFTASKEELDLSVHPVEKRQSCANTRSTRVTKTETFTDWDVQMSNVACANAGAMDIFVMAGWSVANSVSVSAGLDPTIIKDWLKASFGVEYTRTWTSSASVQNKGTVAAGNCGVMITQPRTTRRYGSVYQGCIGNQKQLGTFMADDRGSGNYNGVSWIAGAVSMCAKPGRGPPLSRCNGQGNFV